VTKLVGVLGSVTPPGRLLHALTWGLDAANEASPGLTTDLLNLADYRIPFADGRPLDQLDDDTPAVVRRVDEANAVILASPVYRGSMTGAMKNLLDLLPLESLRGKACGVIAMGATQHHYLGVDWHLRDVLAWFGALVAPTSVYLASSDFAEGALTETARAEVRALVETVLALEKASASIGLPQLGPAPLAGRRG
jgi:NAD(P)H-dependent FMN reductase